MERYTEPQRGQAAKAEHGVPALAGEAFEVVKREKMIESLEEKMKEGRLKPGLRAYFQCVPTH